MRNFVYLFIAIFSASVGATLYFSLGFTPIEAALAGMVVLVGGALGLGLELRRRSDKVLERTIGDLTRIVSRESAIVEKFSHKFREIEELDLGSRIQVLEADISVLGSVVRQLAEAVAEIEERGTEQSRGVADRAESGHGGQKPAGSTPKPEEPVIPTELVRQAVAEDRIIVHMQPIVTLPQRRVHGYDLVPMLLLEDGELAGPEDFMPRQGGRIVADIERMLFDRAIKIVRRSSAAGDGVSLLLPLTKATLGDSAALAGMLAVLEANRAMTRYLVFAINDIDFRAATPAERDGLDAIVEQGVAICIDRARSLRLDFTDLSAIGVKYVRVDAGQFVNAPQTLTDFHSADVASYLQRSGISLIAGNVASEGEILGVLDDGIPLAQGDHIAKAAPVRADLIAETSPAPAGAGKSAGVHQIGG
ncbi:MAG: EAL domain-containing protein [Alphaproteobacteria bacterium]|nr:EAL domain-containing protein [Alphaproteobacteria bacterium]